MYASVSSEKKFVAVGFNFYKQAAKSNFKAVQSESAAIEVEIGVPLEWDELPNRGESRIRIRLGADPLCRTDWPRQHSWMCDKLELLHGSLAPRTGASRGKARIVARRR